MYLVAQRNAYLLVYAALAVLIAGCDTASPPFEYIQLLDAETAADTNTRPRPARWDIISGLPSSRRFANTSAVDLAG